MRLIRDKDIRRRVAAILKDSQKHLPYAQKPILTLKGIDSMFSVLPERRKEAQNQCHHYFERDISFCYLIIFTLTMFYLAICQNKKATSPIPKSWLNKKGKPDPNFIIQNLLLQVVNYALAVVRLVEEGLDNPARSVLRSLNELTGQFIVLSSDRELLAEYVKLHNPKEAKQVWYKLFAKKGRLAKSLAALEGRLGMPESFIAELRSYRDAMNIEHSQAVHHSFASTVIRAFASESDTEILHSALWGKTSYASNLTLDTLLNILVYTLLMFVHVLIDIHNFRFPIKDEFWKAAGLLTECVTKISRAE